MDYGGLWSLSAAPSAAGQAGRDYGGLYGWVQKPQKPQKPSKNLQQLLPHFLRLRNGAFEFPVAG